MRVKNEIIRLRKLGYTYNQIKKELNCSKSTISYNCKKIGLNGSKSTISNNCKKYDLHHPNKLDENLINMIRNEYKNKTAKETSIKYGVSLSTVYKYCKGIKPQKIRKLLIIFCNNCDKKITTRNTQKKFCSNKCRFDFIEKTKIKEWLNGECNGIMGKTSTFRWIKKYLVEKYGNKCMKCGWCEKNEFTDKIPIELDHIDGDYTNNKEENLRLLCPNCHSLTPTYKGANKKRGRPR